ncbi:hypothetical protein YC2023_059774 [Brassica napus]
MSEAGASATRREVDPERKYGIMLNNNSNSCILFKLSVSYVKQSLHKCVLLFFSKEYNPSGLGLNRGFTDPEGEDEDQYPEDARCFGLQATQSGSRRRIGRWGSYIAGCGGDMRTLGVLIPTPIRILRFPNIIFQKSRF